MASLPTSQACGAKGTGPSDGEPTRGFPGSQLFRFDFLGSVGLRACRNFEGDVGLFPALLPARLARLARLVDLLFELLSGLLSDTLSSLLSEILLDGESGRVGGFKIGGDGWESSSGEVNNIPPGEIGAPSGSAWDTSAPEISFRSCDSVGPGPASGTSSLKSLNCLDGLGVLDIFVDAELSLVCEFAVLLLCSDEALVRENMEEMRLAYLFSIMEPCSKILNLKGKRRELIVESWGRRTLDTSGHREYNRSWSCCNSPSKGQLND